MKETLSLREILIQWVIQTIDHHIDQWVIFGWPRKQQAEQVLSEFGSLFSRSAKDDSLVKQLFNFEQGESELVLFHHNRNSASLQLGQRNQSIFSAGSWNSSHYLVLSITSLLYLQHSVMPPFKCYRILGQLVAMKLPESRWVSHIHGHCLSQVGFGQFCFNFASLGEEWSGWAMDSTTSTLDALNGCHASCCHVVLPKFAGSANPAWYSWIIRNTLAIHTSFMARSSCSIHSSLELAPVLGTADEGRGATLPLPLDILLRKAGSMAAPPRAPRPEPPGCTAKCAPEPLLHPPAPTTPTIDNARLASLDRRPGEGCLTAAAVTAKPVAAVVAVVVVITAPVVDAIDDAEPDSPPVPTIHFAGLPLLMGTSDTAATAGSTTVGIAKGVASSHKIAAKSILTNIVMSVTSSGWGCSHICSSGDNWPISAFQNASSSSGAHCSHSTPHHRCRGTSLQLLCPSYLVLQIGPVRSSCQLHDEQPQPSPINSHCSEGWRRVCQQCRIDLFGFWSMAYCEDPSVFLAHIQDEYEQCHCSSPPSNLSRLYFTV